MLFDKWLPFFGLAINILSPADIFLAGRIAIIQALQHPPRCLEVAKLKDGIINLDALASPCLLAIR
jgi:hypothetical protein